MNLENLHPDEYITVLQGPPIFTNTFVVSSFGDMNAQRTADSSLNGLPLKVLAINTPYVAVEYNDPTGRVSRFPLDSRQWQLTKISNEYATALLGDIHASH